MANDGAIDSQLHLGEFEGEKIALPHKKENSPPMLTETQCKAAACPAGKKRLRLTDSGGLYLEVDRTAARWYWKYRIHGTDKLTGGSKLIEKRLALGSYPAVSLKAARNARDEARLSHNKGTDPIQERKNARQARRVSFGTTFESVAKSWYEHWKGTQTARHADYVWRRLQADAFPEIGARAITDLDPQHLAVMAKKIEARGAAHIARRVLQTCGQVFRYAIANGIIKHNPAADFKPGDILKKRKTTNYARLEAKDIPELLRKIEIYNGSPYTRLAMKLMAVVFVRTGELIGARWDEFEDLDGNAPLWRIPAARMKMDTPHLVPLSKQAINIIACLNEVRTKSPYLFPGEGKRDISMSNNTILYALYRLGYKGRMTGHGFRGVASTILHELGWRHDLIELQLAHQERDQVSGAYNHATYLPARRDMMQAWADHLDSMRDDRKVIAGKFGKAA